MTQKEKLEEDKRLYKTANADQKYVLESLFPELKESEDERIRKGLINYFNDFTLPTFGGLESKKILSWLEKQGEQKPWSEEDEDILNTIINHFEIDLECTENDDIIRWLKSLKP